MPLDNIKTRMQSIGAETRYRNSFDCLLKVGSYSVQADVQRSQEKKVYIGFGEVQHHV